MPKPSAIFSCTPVKNVRTSPATNRPNSVKSKPTTQQTTPNITNSSPRRCKIQTEIESRGGFRSNINVKSKLQINCQMSPKITQDNQNVRPSPKKERNVGLNDMRHKDMRDIKKQPSGLKVETTMAGVNRRDMTTAAIQGSCEHDPLSSDMPMKVNVKSMRSCFERRENKTLAKPPPSPSPSRAKSRLAESHPVTPRNANHSIKGILSSKSKYDNNPNFRVPSGSNTPTPRQTKLRRSVSAGSLLKFSDSPKQKVNLARSSSQTITPKHRVKFLDEVTPECFSPVLLESKGDHGSGESIAGEITNLKVAVRVRPPFPGERSVVSVEGNCVKVNSLGSEHAFFYDYCFDSIGDSAASQQDVFDTLVLPLVDIAFQGYNVCLFAYGQTGTGKSYSMMGEEVTTSHHIPEQAGIIPRFSQQLFSIIEGSEEYSQTKVEISYFEIYNEKIHDLLGPSQSGRSGPLKVREHPELGPYVVDLTMHSVYSLETLQNWLQVGNSHKAMAATDFNMNSSRSHSIFTVTLIQSQADDRPSLCSKINLIDLAGSERLAHTCATGDRLKEGVSINRSLLTLGKVISSLAENKKRGFIPYRESVLTWLLKESLGGNSCTAMLATISPSSQYVDETLSTLRYACQARNIVNTVRINESSQEKKIRELLEEVERLKNDMEIRNHTECLDKQNNLQAQLDQSAEDLTRTKTILTEKEKEIEKLKYELSLSREIDVHCECEDRIFEIKKDLIESSNLNTRYEVKVKDLEETLSDVKDKNFFYEKRIRELEQQNHDFSTQNVSFKINIDNLKREVQSFQNRVEEYKLEIRNLNQELAVSKQKIQNYEEDINGMKNSMTEIKKNSSHDLCDTQILQLQATLTEAERYNSFYKNKIKTLEKKCSETTNFSNHDGCEKEISALRVTISELKNSGNHTKCKKEIEKFKTALTEAEQRVTEMRDKIQKLNDENGVFQLAKELNQKEIQQLNIKLREAEGKQSHEECEDRINTLKKALSVAKSMNAHTHCETHIAQLETQVQNLQALSDHTRCEEKINNLFFAIEKYADENTKLVKSYNAKELEYTETISTLEKQLKDSENKKSLLGSTQDATHFQSQLKLLREENSKLKKKKVDDDKKVSSLEQQVISLTKELLDVKNQLRISLREKESSDSLCAQLQEQLIQQDRKLALPQCSRELFVDDKENWETPSKVIRRSIAQHANSNKDDSRCSLVMKAEEIHQAVKDAEDICSRLKIPWVFHLEPEVTTHSWFDVNVRVWDQRTMSSVRWPRAVFLGWLQEMKEEIMSKSRGHKLFHSAPWLKINKDPDLLPVEPDHVRKGRPFREEVESLRNQIVALENLCEPKDKREVLSAVTALGRAVTQLSHRLGLSSPLRPSDMNAHS